LAKINLKKCNVLLHCPKTIRTASYRLDNIIVFLVIILGAATNFSSFYTYLLPSHGRCYYLIPL